METTMRVEFAFDKLHPAKPTRHSETILNPSASGPQGKTIRHGPSEG